MLSKQRQTYMPNGCLNTHAQWLYKYGPLNHKLIRPVAISIHTPSGNINIVLEI